MPYGFPSGDQPKERIISSLESFPKRAGPGTQLENLMHQSGIDVDHVEEFRDELAGAHHITIDRFLQNRPDFEGIGKLAIAAALIPFEHDSIVPLLFPWKARPETKAGLVHGLVSISCRRTESKRYRLGSGSTYNHHFQL
jgi:hypothetical protein